MLKVFLLICSTLFLGNCFCQAEQSDSLVALLNKSTEDTAKVNLLNDVAVSYFNTSADTAIKYGTQAKELAEKVSYTHGLAYALKNIGIAYYMQADYIQTLTYWNQSLQQFENAKDKKGVANILSNLGAVYYNKGDDAKALDYYLKALKAAEEINDTLRLATVLNNIGAVYFNNISTHDKALTYYLKSLPLCEAFDDSDAIGTITVNIGEIYLERNKDTLAIQYFERSLKAYENSKNISYSLNDIGKVYEKRKDYTMALKYHQEAFEAAKKLTSKLEMSQSLEGIAGIYLKMNQTQKALEAYKQAQVIANEIEASYELKNIYLGLSGVYASLNDYHNAYKYEVLLNTIKDTLYNAETYKKIAFLQFSFDIQKKQSEIDLLTKDKMMQDLDLNRQKTVRNSLLAILLLVIFITFILFRNYRIKDRTNALLDSQKKELERTVNELKTTQTQLIQSEKMASLGELTTGIAHEIQNPLNFVNNFSEVNKEMIAEMVEEINKGNYEEAKEIAKGLEINEEKIIHHGKRADAIVKGMLQHSRTSSGKKELTDINALCDEYLRLSYHGVRAKDKNFNAEMKMDFDGKINKINIVPQDIVRVLINMFNNAFYAVKPPYPPKADEHYEPMVKVSTKKIGDKVEITIADNGSGIPKSIVDKIFQPFFTTKPAGQGTGLGLSLSYDIIKAHGGEIKVKTSEGEGTEFIIQLPI